jgi:hypothetical protein
MAVAAKVRPADRLAGKLCTVEPLEHRQLLSAAYGGGWVAPRAHLAEAVGRSAAVTADRIHAKLNADFAAQAPGRGDDGWGDRPEAPFGIDRTQRVTEVGPAWRFGRTAAASDPDEGSDWKPVKDATDDDETAQPAVVGPGVTHTVEVVGAALVVKAGPVLQRLFVPLAVVEPADEATQGAVGNPAAENGGGGGAVAARGPQWRGQEPAKGPQNYAADAPASPSGAVSAQNVSRNLAAGTDNSPHLAQANELVARPQAADVAQAVVQGMAATSTAAMTRAAGDVLAGGPVPQSAVAGAVEGVVAAGAVARAAMLGSAQGFFWVSMAAVSDEADPSQYVLAAAPLTSAQVAQERVAGMTSKVAQVAAAAEHVLPAAVEAAVGQLVPGRFIHIPRIDALASFNDAMLAFIDDSAMMPKPVTHSRTRAWAVTVVVIAADVALLVHWHRGRSDRPQGKPRPKVAYQATA